MSNLRLLWAPNYQDRHFSCPWFHPSPGYWATQLNSYQQERPVVEDFYGRCEKLWFRKTLWQYSWTELDFDRSPEEVDNGEKALVLSTWVSLQTICIVSVEMVVYWPNRMGELKIINWFRFCYLFFSFSLPFCYLYTMLCLLLEMRYQRCMWLLDYRLLEVSFSLISYGALRLATLSLA